MVSRPIKLQLDGEEVHLVPERELRRWTGYVHARRAAFELMTPANIRAVRDTLFVPHWKDTEGVFGELRKQLEDGSAQFFEVRPGATQWDDPDDFEIHDLVPKGGDDDNDPRPDRPPGGLHWVEIVCVSSEGLGYPGASGRVWLPDGRAEFVTLDGASSVRFDDIAEGGTVRFELAGDAEARGAVTLDGFTRYTLGDQIGLTTRRRHVLQVHPNPLAFVSVELVFENGDPVLDGNFTLSTKKGEQAGPLPGEVVRADGLPLPSTSTYAFDAVLPPPRALDPDDPVDPDAPAPLGPDPFVPEPVGPEPIIPGEEVASDGLQVVLVLEDGTPLRAAMAFAGGGVDETVTGDAAAFEGVDGPVKVSLSELVLEPEEPEPAADDASS